MPLLTPRLAKRRYERLEPDERKLSCPVLRGLGGSNPVRLPGDTYGAQPDVAKKPSKDIQAHQRMLAEKLAGRSGKGEEKLALKEKVENVRCYFGSNEELEKEKGGRTHHQ